MVDHTPHEWVLPAAIPFSDLKGKDLEECVYWLLDAMGAKDLEWRTGGSGGGAADGGRDLEAHFFEPDDEGELKQQRWWIECKGRTGTVEPYEVKSAVNNALAYDGIDRLIIATNTQFSNPTRDWVKEWQRKHPSPKVQLWDQTHLERYLSHHPDVVLRLFSEALSIHGRFLAMESRFWNKLEFVPPQTLIDLWKERHSIDMNSTLMFAAIANEFAGGNIAQRPWGAALDGRAAVHVLAIGLYNIAYLVLRSVRAGVDQQILYRTLAYLLLIVLSFLPADTTAHLMINSLSGGETHRLPEEALRMFLKPIMNQLLSEMRDVCSDSCERISTFNRSALMKDRDEVETYWLRLELDGSDAAAETRNLILERQDAPCAVGFSVNKDHGCPLFEFEASYEDVSDFMSMIQRVAAFRRSEATTKRKRMNASDDVDRDGKS